MRDSFMNLKYVDYLESKQKNRIKRLYLNSFPKDERFPFCILKHSIKNKKSVLYEALEDDKFIGMYYIVNCNKAVYLMYFAIDYAMRNKHYGSKILEDLKIKYGTIFLSIEKPHDVESSNRKKFYLKNSFYETNKYYEDNGIVYELLCTDKDYEITEEILKTRYSNMSNSKIIKYIIGKIFNMNNIKFIKY
jgi:hypothetical protein